ncbi:TPA: hypothetical protein N0F65_008259 [Lagenidium giganteum]|uniref:Uncharacterized protein n=1 Tax=Lagenidium giganteum TaxID=4803 RepID=A0AAV2YLH4_9STRA|nr:TPA: hypothetical protein N0F65_008259 [Lagenidium giganteum]
MPSQAVAALLALVVLLPYTAWAAGNKHGFFTPTRSPKSPSHPLVQEAADYAVAALRELSDSGIYQTLQLDQIHDAAAEIGEFHYVIHMSVALASPYFRSRQPTEDFQLIVLESKEKYLSPDHNDSRSFAIDEFPVMDEDAIEEFWIAMVEDRRRRRNKLFAQWLQQESEAENQSTESEASPARPQTVSAKQSKKKRKTLTLEDLDKMSTKQLRRLLHAPESTVELRDAITAIIDDRWDHLEQLDKHVESRDER